MAAGWTLVTKTPIKAHALTVERYRHECGALHDHLAKDDQHRAFMVAFRTPPSDDTGLPHILEHTTLCGSKRYPVRDPFFNMLKRSLQTFMNAMTFPDMTCYPFSSQVAKDYDNLLAVYLDAVFRPILHELDFAQEGHRLEADNGAWKRKGVVFNEMKGAMDSTDSQMHQAIARVLLPQTCYHSNSGGEPAAIPSLKHADLVAFHRRCYRPGNAYFTTYGSIEAAHIHRALEPYLDHGGESLPPQSLQRALKSQNISVKVPFTDEQDILDCTSASLTWAWGDVGDSDEALLSELIDRLLLGHAGAPLRLALESSGLGRSLDGSGYSGEYRNGLFSVALDGIDPKDYPRFEPLVRSTLEKVRKEGFSAAEIAAALHQLELARREISGDHYPYGLDLCLRATMAWNFGADPLSSLDQDASIARLRERAQPAFLADQIEERLLAARHRVLAFAEPDREFHQRAEQLEKQQVDDEVRRADDAKRLLLRQKAEALAQRQAHQDDPDILPQLTLSDVPAERQWQQPRMTGDGLTVFTPSTNGLLHHLACVEIPDLSGDDADLIALLAETVGNIGAGELGYADWSAKLNATCGGLWSWYDITSHADDLDRLNALLFMEVKGLGGRHQDFLGHLGEAWLRPRFDEPKRLRELIEQALQRLQERVQSSGHSFAMRAAMRGFGGSAGLAHDLSGIGRVERLKSLVEDFEKSDRKLAEVGGRLRNLQIKLHAAPHRFCVVGDIAAHAEVVAQVRKNWISQKSSVLTPLRAATKKSVENTAYTTATGVNYCALVFPTVPLAHDDAAALAVACRYLTHVHLHPKLREQGGAYGGSAHYQGDSGVVGLTSYRDPRLLETYSDMRGSLRELAKIPDDERLLREAILGVIAMIDTPASPAGEAKARWISDLKGLGPDKINALRRRILATTCADIRRASARWLDPDGGVAAAVTSAEAAKALGWRTEAI